MQTVDQNGPAWGAGLRPNQLITHINGRFITGLQHVQVLYLMAGMKSHSMTISGVPLEDTSIRKVKCREAPAKGRRIGGLPGHQHSSASGNRRPSHLLTHVLKSEMGHALAESPIRYSGPATMLHSSPHRSKSFNEGVHKRLMNPLVLERQRKPSQLSTSTTNRAFSGRATQRSTTPSTESPISPISQRQLMKSGDEMKLFSSSAYYTANKSSLATETQSSRGQRKMGVASLGLELSKQKH